MRYRLRTLRVLMAVASWLLMGCRQNSITPTLPKAAIASYGLEVRSENGSSEATLFDNSDATVGAFQVRIQDGQITVNKRSYGKLNAGDKVLIQSDGQVLINLEVREPWDKRE